MADVFSGLLDSFTLALDAEGKSPKTVENYPRAVVGFPHWLRAHDQVDDVNTVHADDVHGWLVSLKGNVSPSTEYRNYSGCRQFFAWCVREGELDVLPMVNVRPPKVPEPRTVMLTADQMRALLAGCAGKDFVSRRDRAIIMLLADTGMRRAKWPRSPSTTSTCGHGWHSWSARGAGRARRRSVPAPRRRLTDTWERGGSTRYPSCRRCGWRRRAAACSHRTASGRCPNGAAGHRRPGTRPHVPARVRRRLAAGRRIPERPAGAGRVALAADGEPIRRREQGRARPRGYRRLSPMDAL
jgi:hypothetical protein